MSLPLSNKTMIETKTQQAVAVAIKAGFEICICAASRYNGKVWRGNRHNHSNEAMQDELSYTMSRQEMFKAEVGRDTGFVTNFNRYVDREEGFNLQLAAGIPSATTEVGDDYRNGLLFSEDLY